MKSDLHSRANIGPLTAIFKILFVGFILVLGYFITEYSFRLAWIPGDYLYSPIVSFFYHLKAKLTAEILLRPLSIAAQFTMIFVLLAVAALVINYIAKQIYYSPKSTNLMQSFKGLFGFTGQNFRSAYSNPRVVYFRMDHRHWLLHYLKGAILGLVLMSLVILFMWLFGGISLKVNPQLDSLMVYAIALQIPGWMIQSAGEEFVCRGLVLSSVSKATNPVIGLLISSGMFAALHLNNAGVGILPIINLFIAGLLFGLVVIYFGSIWASCGLHFMWNMAESNVYGSTVSGIHLQPLSFFITETHPKTASSLVVGGNFGPEGTLVLTIVFALVGLAIIFKLMANLSSGGDIYRRFQTNTTCSVPNHKRKSMKLYY